MKRNFLYRLVLRLCAGGIVRDIYRGILGREPDSAGLRTYRDQLLGTEDLSAVVADISASREAWLRNLYSQPAELARLLLRGLKRQEPDQPAIDACATHLRDGDLPAVLGALAASKGHWESLIELHAEELVRAVFETLLERGPDEYALRFYCPQLKERKNLSWLLAAVAQSQ